MKSSHRLGVGDTAQVKYTQAHKGHACTILNVEVKSRMHGVRIGNKYVNKLRNYKTWIVQCECGSKLRLGYGKLNRISEGLDTLPEALGEHEESAGVSVTCSKCGEWLMSSRIRRNASSQEKETLLAYVEMHIESHYNSALYPHALKCGKGYRT